MEKNLWEWLEIEPTNNIDEIKAAYAEAAKKYHPVEHPEEFMKLRDCYKTAVTYARYHENQDIPELLDEQDFEDEQEYQKSRDEELFNTTNISGATTASDSLSFSSIVYEDEFSIRQKKLLYFTRMVMESIWRKHDAYDHKWLYEELLKFLCSKQNRKEMTPEFMDIFLDIIVENDSINSEFVELIDQYLFAGNTENTDEKTRFLSMRLHSFDTYTYPDKVFRVNRNKICISCFSHYSDEVALSCQVINIYDEGNIQFRQKITACPIKDILLINSNGLSLYFMEDLKSRLDPDTGEYTIYDNDGNKLLTMSLDLSNYQYLLDKISRNGCMVETQTGYDQDTHVTTVTDIKKFYKYITYRLKIALFHGMIVAILFALSLIVYPGLDRKMNDVIGLFCFLITAMCYLAVWVPAIKFAFSLLRFLKALISILFVFPFRKSLKEDAERDGIITILGSGVYVSSRYILWRQGYAYHITRLDKIKKLSIFDDKKKQTGFLVQIYSSTSGLKNFEITDEESALALYRIIHERAENVQQNCN